MTNDDGFLDRVEPGLALPDFALPDFALPNLDGTVLRLSEELAGKRGGVVVFWSSVCSHCVRYDAYLGGLAGHDELALLVVACRQTETLEQLRSAVHERRLRFRLVHDAERAAAHAWRVEQTPRVFLVDRERCWRYRGAIDNFKLPRDPDHRPYLDDAIAAFLAGRPIERQEVPSFGCAIESIYYTS